MTADMATAGIDPAFTRRVRDAQRQARLSPRRQSRHSAGNPPQYEPISFQEFHTDYMSRVYAHFEAFERN